MAEKRHHKRATAQGLASYVWVGSKLSSSIIENVSAGGLFYRTPKPVALGSAVRIRLVQPGIREPIELTGRVVSSIEPSTAIAQGVVPGSGIRFDPVPDAQRDRFNRLLTKLGLPPIEEAPELPLEFIEPLPAAAAAVESAPLPERSVGYSYRVNQAAAQVAVPVRPTAVAATQQPQRIDFELAPARSTSAGGKPAEQEKQRLMAHIEGMLKQLTELQENLRLRDDEVARLTAENTALRAYLASYHTRFGPL